MSDHKLVLDDICDDIDKNVRAGRLYDRDYRASFIETSVSSRYKDFAHEYLEQSLEYHAQVQNFSKSNDSLVDRITDMDLMRIGITTFLGSMAGSIVSKEYAIIGAGIGFSLTVIDEIIGYHLNLFHPLIGAVLGTVFSTVVGDSYISAEAGAVIGGGLGLLKSGANAFLKYEKKEQETQKKIKNLEREYTAQRQQLIEQTELVLESKDVLRIEAQSSTIKNSKIL
ncbi:MAG: hypothetical protein Q8R37_02980 [Nanoarchaeota archaeon]|nr:hypothetical protein [Nanoarchaeota archaeon]